MAQQNNPPCVAPGCKGRLKHSRTHWTCGKCGQHVIRPQPGPQEAASASAADIVIYGGAAGGGKSWSLIFEAARYIRTPGYSAIIFRRTTKQVTGGGSIWDESQSLYPILGGVPREHRLDWKFGTGDDEPDATVEFGHLEHEKNKLDHQGKQYAGVFFDELTHFTETQFWYLQTRARTTCGVRPRVWGTCNPDPDSWVRTLIDWWIGDDGLAIPERSGVLRWFARLPDDSLQWGNTQAETHAEAAKQVPELRLEDVKSLTFIPAGLDDNAILTDADPSYRATLMSMPRIERERLLGANWNTRAVAGMFFRRSYFEIVDHPPAKPVKRVRAWDLAATEPTKENPDPDWTVGVLVSIDRDNVLYVEHVERLRKGPLGVERSVRNLAVTDGQKTHVAMWQDPGQAGKAQITHWKGLLLGYVLLVERAAKNKQEYAKPVSSTAEGGRIKVVRGPWNDAFLGAMEAFPPPKGGHDDDPDAMSLAHLKLIRNNLERLRLLAGL